jgi:hypothetical protein
MFRKFLNLISFEFGRSARLEAEIRQIKFDSQRSLDHLINVEFLVRDIHEAKSQQVFKTFSDVKHCFVCISNLRLRIESLANKNAKSSEYWQIEKYSIISEIARRVSVLVKKDYIGEIYCESGFSLDTEEKFYFLIIYENLFEEVEKVLLELEKEEDWKIF